MSAIAKGDIDFGLDTFMQPWGDNFVANYSAEGYRVFDIISALPN